MKYPCRNKQAGFTLVEIAIVLVIIGLLLGGVLRGQEMIENSRVKSATNDMNGIIAAFNSYIDRYRRQPGDDGPIETLTTRGGNWATIPSAGDSNGTVNATAANTFTAGGEVATFFQHLRAAGFLNGNPNAIGVNSLPGNAWGGLTSIVNVAVQGRPAARLAVCMGNVPGRGANALDVQLDDGLPGGGALRATQGANNVQPGDVAATYNEAQTYTICRDLN